MSETQSKALLFLVIAAVLANLGILETWAGIAFFAAGFWGWEIIKRKI